MNIPVLQITCVDDDDDESIGYVRPLLQLKTVTSVLMIRSDKEMSHDVVQVSGTDWLSGDVCTCDGGLAVARHGDAGDRLGVVVGLGLSGRMMLKERPHVDAILQHQSAARMEMRSRRSLMSTRGSCEIPGF